MGWLDAVREKVQEEWRNDERSKPHAGERQENGSESDRVTRNLSAPEACTSGR
jgi:hypothetical protein